MHSKWSSTGGMRWFFDNARLYAEISYWCSRWDIILDASYRPYKSLLVYLRRLCSKQCDLAYTAILGAVWSRSAMFLYTEIIRWRKLFKRHAADDYSRRHFRCIYVAESSNQYRFSFNVSVHSTHFGSNSEQSDLGKDCLYVFKVGHFCFGHIHCKWKEAGKCL